MMGKDRDEDNTDIDEDEVIRHAKKRLDDPSDKDIEHIKEDIEAFKRYTKGTTTDDAKMFIDSLLSERERRRS